MRVQLLSSQLALIDPAQPERIEEKMLEMPCKDFEAPKGVNLTSTFAVRGSCTFVMRGKRLDEGHWVGLYERNLALVQGC